MSKTNLREKSNHIESTALFCMQKAIFTTQICDHRYNFIITPRLPFISNNAYSTEIRALQGM